MRFDKPIYIVDWQKLVLWLIPTPLRQARLMAWIQALAAPIGDVYLRFLALKNNVDYELSITPQVCYLEKMLNDKWDSALRRIRIVKPVLKSPVVLYRRDENKRVVIFKKSENKHLVFFKKNESEAFVVDFIVEVPGDVVFDRYEMSARLENKILPSKIFDIKIV